MGFDLREHTRKLALGFVKSAQVSEGHQVDVDTGRGPDEAYFPVPQFRPQGPGQMSSPYGEGVMPPPSAEQFSLMGENTPEGRQMRQEYFEGLASGLYPFDATARNLSLHLAKRKENWINPEAANDIDYMGSVFRHNLERNPELTKDRAFMDAYKDLMNTDQFNETFGGPSYGAQMRDLYESRTTEARRARNEEAVSASVKALLSGKAPAEEGAGSPIKELLSRGEGTAVPGPDTQPTSAEEAAQMSLPSEQPPAAPAAAPRTEVVEPWMPPPPPPPRWHMYDPLTIPPQHIPKAPLSLVGDGAAPAKPDLQPSPLAGPERQLERDVRELKEKAQRPPGVTGAAQMGLWSAPMQPQPIGPRRIGQFPTPGGQVREAELRPVLEAVGIFQRMMSKTANSLAQETFDLMVQDMRVWAATTGAPELEKIAVDARALVEEQDRETAGKIAQADALGRILAAGHLAWMLKAAGGSAELSVEDQRQGRSFGNPVQPRQLGPGYDAGRGGQDDSVGTPSRFQPPDSRGQ